jgi:hypothetical protein
MTKKNTAVLCRVTEVHEIEDAPEWERIILDGKYQIVYRKGILKENDQKLFVPSGSWIPSSVVTLSETGTYKDVEGGYLPLTRTFNHWSEGLIFNPEMVNDVKFMEWQRDLPKDFQTDSNYYKTFPKFLKSPEIIHCQDLSNKIFKENDEYEITPFLDGITVICYVKNERFGICTTKYEIQEHSDDPFWKYFREMNLPDTLTNYADNFAIYGTIVGKGIYSNLDNFEKRKFFVHDMYSIDQKEFVTNVERYNAFTELCEYCDYGTFDHVPVFQRGELNQFCENFRELIDYSDGQCMAPYSKRKGLVFKSLTNPQFKFKVPSPLFKIINKL